MIRAVCRGIVVAFFKGTAGDNKYGSDPLLAQPASNTNYWIVGLVAFVLSMLLSSLTGETDESQMYRDLMNNSTGDMIIDQDLNVGEGDDEMFPTNSETVMTGGEETQRVDMTDSGVMNENIPSDTPTMNPDSIPEQPAIDPMESAEGGV